MVWFISEIANGFSPVLLPVLLHGRLVGDETGLWFAIAALFVAIALVGGALLAFLIRTARDSDRAWVQPNAAPDWLAGPDSK